MEIGQVSIGNGIVPAHVGPVQTITAVSDVGVWYHMWHSAVHAQGLASLSDESLTVWGQWDFYNVVLSHCHGY